jgi:SPP1 gp7 family putative phage head morphogenesis protein
MRPDFYRTQSRDLVRPGAYWRPFNRIEQRFDFAAIEVNEGILLQKEREILARILLAEMERIVAWTRSASFGPSSAPKLEMPAPLQKQMENAFVRVAYESYSAACQAYDKARLRADEMDGLRPRKYPRSGLTGPAVRRLDAESRQKARAFVEGIRKQILPILTGVFALDGRRVKPQELLEGELRTAFSTWIDVAPPPATVALAAAPPDARVAGWLRVSPNRTSIDTKDGGSPIKPQLNRNVTQHVLETEATAQRAQATRDSTLRDGGAVALRYSAVMDEKTCGDCRARDGKVADKNDDFWVFNTPPMHPRCRCSIHPVRATDPVPLTPAGELEAISTAKLPPGYGAYDPGTVQGLPTYQGQPGSETLRPGMPVAMSPVRDFPAPDQPRITPAGDQAIRDRVDTMDTKFQAILRDTPLDQREDLAYWTSRDGHVPIAQAFRADPNAAAVEYKPFMDFLQEGPKVDGVVWRAQGPVHPDSGEPMDPSAFVETMEDRVGQNMPWKVPASSSLDPGTAQRYALDGNRVIYEMRMKGGATYVNPLSVSPSNEAEAIIRPGTRYRIISVHRDVPFGARGERATVIRLEEV